MCPFGSELTEDVKELVCVSLRVVVLIFFWSIALPSTELSFKLFQILVLLKPIALAQCKMTIIMTVFYNTVVLLYILILYKYN